MERIECVRVGVVSPPKYFDLTPAQVHDCFGREVEVMQTVMRIPEFQYRRSDFSRSLPAVDDAIRDLAEAGCNIVLQVGSPFCYFNERGYLELVKWRDELAENLQITIEPAALSLIDALHFLGLRRVSISGMYYDAEWLAAMHSFLEQAGIRVLFSENFVDQGLYEGQPDEYQTLGWEFPADIVYRSLMNTISKRTNDTDAVILGGMPAAISNLSVEVEKSARCPVFGVEQTLIWAALRASDLISPSRRRPAGVLFDKLYSSSAGPTSR